MYFLSKKLKLNILSFFVLLALSAGIFLINLPQSASAQSSDYGLTETAQRSGLTGTSTTTLPQLLGRIIGAVLALVGVIFLILVIFGGITWMTAGGNEEKVKKARELIVNSVVGLVIILAAYAIVNFVFNTILTATKK